MSEAEDGRLYGLMEVAEGQQAAVQAALEGLAAERAALRREREALARQVQVQVQVQVVEGGARAAVRAAVAEGLAGAAVEGAAAVQAATGRSCPGWLGWRSRLGRRMRRPADLAACLSHAGRHCVPPCMVDTEIRPALLTGGGPGRGRSGRR